MKLYFSFLLLTVIFVSQATSQNITQSITGSVQDNITGELLAGANILVIGLDPPIGTTSDVDGRFELRHIPVGLISLRVSFVGYQTVEIQNRELRSGKELNLNVFMEERVILGEEVVIRGSVDKKGTINTMTSVSSRTFTIDETRRYAGSRGDVARMASNFAGVQVASDDRNDIVIRGNSPAGLQWRLEGLDIPNPNHYGAFGSTGGPVSMLNNNQLDNSDFLTGAFPAEYGNSLSGVFDLKLKNGNSDKYELMTMVGFNGFEVGAEGPIQRKNNSSFIANFRYSTMEVFDLMGVSFGTGTAVPKYEDFSFKINLPTKKAGVFSLYSIGGKSNIEFLDSERDTNEVDFYGGEGWDMRTGSEMAVIGVNHAISINKTALLKTAVSASYQYFFVKQDSIVPESKVIIPYYYSNFKETRILFSTFIKKRVNAKNNFQVGVNVNYYMSNLQDSLFKKDMNQFITLTTYKGHSSLIRPYLSWQWKLSERLVFNAGVDYMYYTFNATSSLEPRFGVNYYLGTQSKISLGYGLHSQLLPTTVYNRETYLGNGQYVAMNHDLSLQKSHHLVLAYDWNITDFSRVKAETYFQYIFDAAINAHDEDAYSVLNQGADFYVWNPDTLVSTGTGKNYGVELTYEHFLRHGFYALSTASLFESKYKGSDGIERNTAFNSNFVFNLLLGKEWELHKNSTNPKLTSKKRVIGADIKLNLAGGRRYTPIDEDQSKIEHRPVYITNETYARQFNNYFRSDLKIYFKHGGKKSNYEVGIDLQNLTNAQNIYSQNFNTSTGEIYYTYQLGMMVIPYVRFEF